MNTAKIVIDLGFGDGGKGLIVDNLCAEYTGWRAPLVVRFSGGQQCGHTVITPEGVKHVFSSFGAGSLAGGETFFTEDTTMYLPALLNEWAILKEKCTPRMTIHPLAMLTTPYDVAYNRAKEDIIIKHGSCGLGVGATMKRCIETPFKTFVQDLAYPSVLIEKMKSVYGYYDRIIAANDELRSAFNKYAMDLVPQFHDALYGYTTQFGIGSRPRLVNRAVIFEGSQGIMLDMDHGVFPNVTYANTTCKNAMKYINKWGLNPEMYYTTRCYTTRHGEGWMPDERPIELINNSEEINTFNHWQGNFRLGEFSYEMINQALRIDECYHYAAGFLPRKNLVITCVDQRPDFRFDATRIFGINEFWSNDSPKRGSLKRI